MGEGGVPVGGPPPAGGRRAGRRRPDPDTMSLIEHLEELRWRLIWSLASFALATVASFAVAGRVLQALVSPVGTVVFLAPAEAFLTQLRVAVFMGLALAAPVILYQLAAFVLPGLERHERRVLYGVLPSASLLFLAGAAFGYLVAVPFLYRFFLSFSSPAVQAQIRISDYLGFVVGVVVPMGVVFELPVLVWGLAAIGLVTPGFLSRNRKYAVLVIFVIAAVLSPPDVVSQFLFASPMLLLYEVSIVVARLAVPRARAGD